MGRRRRWVGGGLHLSSQAMSLYSWQDALRLSTTIRRWPDIVYAPQSDRRTREPEAMKVTIDIDCTPEEARRFLGLPDVAPLQEHLIRELQERMSANLAAMDPETMIKTWLPAGLQGLEQMQKMFWSALSKGPAREPEGGAKAGGRSGG
jgi:hypothetical protein